MALCPRLFSCGRLLCAKPGLPLPVLLKEWGVHLEHTVAAPPAGAVPLHTLSPLWPLPWAPPLLGWQIRPELPRGRPPAPRREEPGACHLSPAKDPR